MHSSLYIATRTDDSINFLIPLQNIPFYLSSFFSRKSTTICLLFLFPLLIKYFSSISRVLVLNVKPARLLQGMLSDSAMFILKRRSQTVQVFSKVISRPKTDNMKPSTCGETRHFEKFKSPCPKQSFMATDWNFEGRIRADQGILFCRVWMNLKHSVRSSIYQEKEIFQCQLHLQAVFSWLVVCQSQILQIGQLSDKWMTLLFCERWEFLFRIQSPFL